MDDYFIGIRLALDNGVSAGLENIRADLFALDKAVAASAAGLQSLSVPKSLAPLPLHPVPPVPKLPLEMAANTENAAPTQPVGAISPNLGERPSVPRVRIDTVPSVPTAPAFGPTAPAVQHSPMPSVGAEFSTIQSSAPVRDVVLGSAAARMTTQPSPQIPPATSFPVNEISVAPRSEAALNVGQTEAQVRASFAPPAQPSPNSPQGGNVYLDGERLGHWVASHLAREANRPSFGPTGFDPTLSIAWPGASQGGL